MKYCGSTMTLHGHVYSCTKLRGHKRWHETTYRGVNLEWQDDPDGVGDEREQDTRPWRYRGSVTALPRQ